MVLSVNIFRTKINFLAVHFSIRLKNGEVSYKIHDSYFNKILKNSTIQPYKVKQKKKNFRKYYREFLIERFGLMEIMVMFYNSKI